MGFMKGNKIALGRKHTEEAKKRMSESRKKYLKKNPEAIERLRLFLLGKPRNKETKEKLRLANIGKCLSEETKRRIGLSQIGRKFSEESKKKMSETIKEFYKNNPNELERWRKINLGRHHSEEVKKKMSLKKLGSHPSEEAKIKMRVAAFEYAKRMRGIKYPNIGKNEKLILDKIQDKMGFFIERQFFINGYFLDGYCKELNLAIEVDEDYHQTKNQKARDRIKQESVIDTLNCKFVRVKERDFKNGELSGSI